jgi:hypothetical protein
MTNPSPFWMKYIKDEKIILNLIQTKQMDPNEIYWYSIKYITPIAEAIWNNAYKTVEVLLNNGVDPDSFCTSIGPFYTALEFAVMCWMYEIVVLLLDRGATISPKIAEEKIYTSQKVNQYIKRYIRQQVNRKRALFFCTSEHEPKMMWPVEIIFQFM